MDQIQVTVKILTDKYDAAKKQEYNLQHIWHCFSFVFVQDLAEEKIPMCVIGNKVDLRAQFPEESCVSSLHGEKLAKVCNFHPTWWINVYTDARPSRCLNKLTAVTYVDALLTGVRRLVLRNECQRGNQRHRGCASSSKVRRQSVWVWSVFLLKTMATVKLVFLSTEK